MSYTSNYTGKQIDEAVGTVLDLISGTETITTKSSQAYITKAISLPFTPTANTRIVGSLRRPGTPTPYQKYVLSFTFTSTSLFAVICDPGYTGPSGSVSAGTYYIDWLVLDKGA